MSKLFSAEQYDQEFAPKRLQMYEVPRCEISKNPQMNKREINFIANNNGHLKPGVRKSESNPFGDYVGTWDLPKTIPGPYYINDTGRTTKNYEKLKKQRECTREHIRQARESKKPLDLAKFNSCSNENVSYAPYCTDGSSQCDNNICNLYSSKCNQQQNVDTYCSKGEETRSGSQQQQQQQRQQDGCQEVTSYPPTCTSKAAKKNLCC